MELHKASRHPISKASSRHYNYSCLYIIRGLKADNCAVSGYSHSVKTSVRFGENRTSAMCRKRSFGNGGFRVVYCNDSSTALCGHSILLETQPPVHETNLPVILIKVACNYLVIWKTNTVDRLPRIPITQLDKRRYSMDIQWSSFSLKTSGA